MTYHYAYKLNLKKKPKIVYLISIVDSVYKIISIK